MNDHSHKDTEYSVKLELEIKGLSDLDQKIVNNHVWYKSQFQMFEIIRNKLIDQMHSKKCYKKTTLYHVNSELDNIYYKQILFQGRQEISSFSGIQSSFPCMDAGYYVQRTH